MINSRDDFLDAWEIFMGYFFHGMISTRISVDTSQGDLVVILSWVEMLPF